MSEGINNNREKRIIYDRERWINKVKTERQRTKVLGKKYENYMANHFLSLESKKKPCQICGNLAENIFCAECDEIFEKLNKKHQRNFSYFNLEEDGWGYYDG